MLLRLEQVRSPVKSRHLAAVKRSLSNLLRNLRRRRTLYHNLTLITMPVSDQKPCLTLRLLASSNLDDAVQWLIVLGDFRCGDHR